MGLAIATNQQINNYYDLYRENEIVFTKDILRSLRVDPRQIYVKCAGAQWPCIINSTSFQMAKIIIGTSGGAFRQITHKDAPPVNLCFCFIKFLCIVPCYKCYSIYEFTGIGYCYIDIYTASA